VRKTSKKYRIYILNKKTTKTELHKQITEKQFKAILKAIKETE